MREMDLASYSLRMEASGRRRNIFMFKGSYVRPSSVGYRSLSLTRILISLLCQNGLLLRDTSAQNAAPRKSRKPRIFRPNRPRTIYDNYFIKIYHGADFLFSLSAWHVQTTLKELLSTCTAIQ